MHRLNLTGLRADLPIGAMAAFGVLRVCSVSEGFGQTKLSWEPWGGSHHAVLWTEREAQPDELIAKLREHTAAATNRTEFTWAPAIKSATVTQFRESGRQAIEAMTSGNRETAEWFAAFGSDLVEEDGKLEPTPFDMSVARQRFLADGKKLAGSLNDSEPFQEALFGPWLYRDDQHSLGWDPSTIKMGAFTYKAPTAMPNQGVRAAVWLAFESLPLFPCSYEDGLQTRGFLRAGRETAFSWAVWEGALCVASLKTLLAWTALLHEDFDAPELRARGVRAIYRSARFKPNKYLASFRAPTLVFEAGR